MLHSEVGYCCLRSVNGSQEIPLELFRQRRDGVRAPDEKRLVQFLGKGR